MEIIHLNNIITMLECWNVLNEHQSYRWIFRLIINLVFQRDIWKFKKLSVDLRSLEFTEEALLDERTLMTYFSFTFTSSITRIYFFFLFFLKLNSVATIVHLCAFDQSLFRHNRNCNPHFYVMVAQCDILAI